MSEPPPAPPADPLPPPLKKRDFTIAQLREFDGSDSGKRLLIACNGKVFDVTRGRRFYGPGQHTFTLNSVMMMRLCGQSPVKPKVAKLCT
jgi:hypothetical protein